MKHPLSTVIMLVLALLLVSAATAQDKTTLPNGVASGDVTQTSAVLWTHSTALGTVTFEYAADSAFSSILGSVTAEVTDALLHPFEEVLQPFQAHHVGVARSLQP